MIYEILKICDICCLEYVAAACYWVIGGGSVMNELIDVLSIGE